MCYIPAILISRLVVHSKYAGLRDYAVVYVDGEKVGVLNRNTKTYEMEIEVPFNAELQILVENMGRINYGSEIIHNTERNNQSG